MVGATVREGEDVTYTPLLCINCGHLEDDHIVEDDNAYCIGSLECRCRKRISDSLKASPSNTQRLRALAKAQRGKHLSKAHREKIGNSLRGKPMSEERKHRLSLAKMGHSVSKETRRKISKSKLGRKLGPCSEEHKRRISESRMGHLVSEETRQKLKLAWKVKAAKKCSPK